MGGFYRPNAYRHADAWVGNTRRICDHPTGLGFPRERVFHTGNFVVDPTPDAEPQDVREVLAIPPDAAVIFSLGRFIERNGFADLLVAFARLLPPDGDRPAALVIAGDRPDRGLLEERS